jgi:hypothetical protein
MTSHFLLSVALCALAGFIIAIVIYPMLKNGSYSLIGGSIGAATWYGINNQATSIGEYAALIIAAIMGHLLFIWINLFLLKRIRITQ